MSTIVIEIDGVRASAELFENRAPATVARIRAILPVRGTLRHTRVSGNCAELAVPQLASSVPVENQVTFLDSASISFLPATGTLLFAYGQAQARSATGNLWATGVGRVLSNHEQFYAKLQAARDSGPKPISIALTEEEHEAN